MPNDANRSQRMIHPLSERFYRRCPSIVARGLIGKTLFHQTAEGLCGGIIVETEAYLATNDPASHSARGQTRRNRSMFGPPGRLYVYTIHAKFCCNAVTQPSGKGSAVLIRAIQPRWNISVMQHRRKQMSELRLCRGPAMLCQSLSIDLQQDGCDVTRLGSVWIGRSVTRIKPQEIVAVPRIGISQATDLPLRFIHRGNPFVSGPKFWHDITCPT